MLRVRIHRFWLHRCRHFSSFRLLLVFFFSCSLILFCSNVFARPHRSDIFISLTTTENRFSDEFPIAIYSLLTQSLLPRKIFVFLSKTDENVDVRSKLKVFVKQIENSAQIENLFDEIVEIRSIDGEDLGPSSKFLPIVKEFHQNKMKNVRIIICDDDQFYHSETVKTLDFYSRIYPSSIVGLRGWRSLLNLDEITNFIEIGVFVFSVREDLRWGVGTALEYFYHVIEAHRLDDVYRVGVITANNGYLIRPEMFDFHFYEDFQNVTEDIRRMDDIWLSGNAAKRNVSRLVVPTCCQHRSVTKTHELENFLTKHRMSRSGANDNALRFFKNHWEHFLWYRFHGENRPNKPFFFVRVYRFICNCFQQLRISFRISIREMRTN